MPFITTYHILKAWRDYSYWGLIVYGPLRRGKSSFVIQLLAELYGFINHPDWREALDLPYSRDFLSDAEYTWREWADTYPTPDWDAWQSWMWFLPEEWLDLVDQAQVVGRQQLALAWDDAGVFASKYRYHEIFARAISDYLNVGATDYASFIFTTPDPRWMLKNLRELPGGHTGSVAKTTGNRYQQTLRRIRVYDSWFAPDFKKSGVKALYDDHFDVMLPDYVFQAYEAKRRKYAKYAKMNLREILTTMRGERAERFKWEVRQRTGIDLTAPDAEDVSQEAHV